jgi:bifunctional non-homologous end joining protein LigD
MTRAAGRARRGRGRPVGAGLPARIGLQLARLVAQAPAGEQWLHEVKFDGYRVLLWRDARQARITSRGDQDWTSKLTATARAVQALPCRSCILDGELITLDAAGRSDFGLLQQRFGESDGERRLRVMLFDLLFLDGEDLRAKPQIERKHKLAALLRDASAPLYLSDYQSGDGPQAARSACAAGLEGIVSKARAAPYADGRGHAWLKIKCIASDEFAIVGYTEGQGARASLGSLLLASAEKDGTWRYRGRVGTGLDERLIADLLRRLATRRLARPAALSAAPNRAQLRGAAPLWVTPHWVVEVEFRGYTQDGLLRQASLKGLREDRSVKSLSPSQRDRAAVAAGARARPATGKAGARRAARAAKPAARAAAVRLTHPERVLFDDPPITKEQLAQFYRGIAAFVLPGLVQRPLLLLRCPQGANGTCFFQKHISRGLPPQLHEVADKAAAQRWIYISDLEGLIALVQMNALEYHVWGSTVDDLGRADRLVIDLDPADGVPWRQITAAATQVREQFARHALQSFVRTSGGKGLHIVAPLRPAVPWPAAKEFARRLVEDMAAAHPDRYLSVAAKDERSGRIFLDYLRNARGATAVCSYSLRKRPGAPLATPLAWDELPRLRAADQFRFANIGRRLRQLKADPWADIDRLQQTLPARRG